MKIWFSKPKEGKKRHVVLDMNSREDYDSHNVIRELVLGRGVHPVRAQRGDKVRYRFAVRYLERIALVFPFAEQSPAVTKHLMRASEEELANVPDIEIEGLSATLYDYQKVGVQRSLDGIRETGSHMLNDEMGLGKTVQAIAVALKLNAFPLLIVAPNNAKYVWAREFEKFTDIVPAVVEGPPAQRQNIIEEGYDVTIANFEQLRIKTEGRGKYAKQIPANPAFFNAAYEMFIVDEFHRVKNPTSQQTKGFLAIEADKQLLMSGTPILNRAEEAWPALHRTNPDKYPSYYMFERNLCIKGAFGTIGYRPEGMAQLKEDLQNTSTRRRKEQVLNNLPKVVPVDRFVKLTGEQKRLYDQIEEQGRLELMDGEVKGLAGALPKIMRCKQAAFSPELYEGSPDSAKIKELKVILEELVANGEKAIVFSQWSRATRILQRELEEYNPAYVDGSVKGSDRMAQVDKFNEDRDCKVYIGTIGANKEAITLSAATYVIFMDKDWNPQNNNQAAARSAAGGLRGVGTTKPVHIISIIAEDTIEEHIESLLQEKASLFNALIERDGGKKQERITMGDIRSLFGLSEEEVAA